MVPLTQVFQVPGAQQVPADDRSDPQSQGISHAFGQVERGINEAKFTIEHLECLDPKTRETIYQMLDEVCDHAYEDFRFLCYGEQPTRWIRNDGQAIQEAMSMTPTEAMIKKHVDELLRVLPVSPVWRPEIEKSFHALLKEAGLDEQCGFGMHGDCYQPLGDYGMGDLRGLAGSAGHEVEEGSLKDLKLPPELQNLINQYSHELTKAVMDYTHKMGKPGISPIEAAKILKNLAVDVKDSSFGQKAGASIKGAFQKKGQSNA